MPLTLSAEEVTAFLGEMLPRYEEYYEILNLTEDHLKLKMLVRKGMVRPGGSVAGPAIFNLADTGAYIMTLAHIGRQEMAVTSSASIDFLRRPTIKQNLVGEFRLLKIGRTLCVTDCLICSEGEDTPFARANMTYAIPRQGK